MVKVATKDGSSFSHGGILYEPDDDGAVDIPGDAVEVAASHGFVPVKVKAADEVTASHPLAQMKRGDLLTYLDEHQVPHDPRANLSTLRELVSQQMAIEAAAV